MRVRRISTAPTEGLTLDSQNQTRINGSVPAGPVAQQSHSRTGAGLNGGAGRRPWRAGATQTPPAMDLAGFGIFDSKNRGAAGKRGEGEGERKAENDGADGSAIWWREKAEGDKKKEEEGSTGEGDKRTEESEAGLCACGGVGAHLWGRGRCVGARAAGEAV